MWTAGKLASGMLMAAAAVGAVVVYLRLSGVDQLDWPTPLMMCGLAGFVAGWRHLGSNLGNEFLQSAIFGIGAALIGLVYFAICYGVYSAYVTHVRLQFPTTEDALFHFIEAAVSVGRETLQPDVLLALGIGSAAAGVLAEFFGRIWR